MQVYLVGGAIRDQLLRRPIKERDWVVIGATPEQMLAAGYKPIGKHFPVFLHPQSHEEYALARTERKVAKGYKGFQFYTGTDVTLEQDLQRRDLTINAIASDNRGQLIDPYHGQRDIEDKILRHVSAAFVEDPVRLLRVARFAATFDGFVVADETLALLKKMVTNNEVDALVVERVWKELERSLAEKMPWRFFQVLSDCGALAKIFPQFCLSQVCQTLQASCQFGDDSLLRFAAAFIHLDDKAFAILQQKFRWPSDYCQLTVLANRYYQQFESVDRLSAEQCLVLLESVDAFRRPQRFDKLLLVCQANLLAKSGDADCYRIDYFKSCYQACIAIDQQQIAQYYQGKQIAQAIHAARLAALREMLENRQ